MDDAAAALRQKVIDRAQKDPAYRKLLSSNPREAVKSEIGVELPSGLDIQVVQETAQKIYLVLPPEPVEGALSDDQLESLSGGAADFAMFA